MNRVMLELSRPGAWLFLAAVALTGTTPLHAGESYARQELLVEASWLDENLIDPMVVVIDVRNRDRYDISHIPNSYWLDATALFDREGAPQGLLPADRFKALMESAGIGDDVRVIAVDAIGGRSAATLWWALGYYGFDRVSLLNGGFGKWEAEGRALTGDRPYSRKATFTPKPRPERSVTAEQIMEWRESRPGFAILDARRPPEYEGTFGRAGRKGHVPDALSVPWKDSLTLMPEKHVMVFRPQAELLKVFRAAGVTEDSAWVAYCSDGRRASHLLFTGALIGLSTRGANYTGGWNEWSVREDLPVRRGASKARGGS